MDYIEKAVINQVVFAHVRSIELLGRKTTFDEDLDYVIMCSDKDDGSVGCSECGIRCFRGVPTCAICCNKKQIIGYIDRIFGNSPMNPYLCDFDFDKKSDNYLTKLIHTTGIAANNDTREMMILRLRYFRNLYKDNR